MARRIPTLTLTLVLAMTLPAAAPVKARGEEPAPTPTEEEGSAEPDLSERGLGGKIQEKIGDQKEAAGKRREERREKVEGFVYDKVLSVRESNIVDAVRHLEWDPGCGAATLPFDLALMARDKPEELMQRTLERALEVVVDRFDDLMKDELAKLDRAEGHEASATDLAAGGLAKLRAASSDETGCLVDFAADKWPDDAKRQKLRADLVAKLEAAGEALREKVEPHARNAIAKGLEKILTGDGDDSDLLTEDELGAVANHVLAAHLVAKLDAARQQLRGLKDALGGAEGERLEAIRAAHTDMTFRKNPELADLQRDFAWEVVRAMGHKYIDNDSAGRGGYFVNQAVGLIQLSDGTVEKLASSICGLIPEAGAAVCAIVEEGLDIAWNQILVPAIEDKLTSFLHAEFDRAFDEVRANQQAPEGFEFLTTQLAAGSTWMQGALIQNVVADHLADILGALGGYNDSVYELGQEAASRI